MSNLKKNFSSFSVFLLNLNILHNNLLHWNLFNVCALINTINLLKSYSKEMKCQILHIFKILMLKDVLC